MNKTASIFVSGLCGAIIGSVVTYFISKEYLTKKISKEMEKEFDEAKSLYSDKEELTQAQELIKPSIADMANDILESEGYDYTGNADIPESDFDPPNNTVQIISEQEFSTIEDYQVYTTFWYENDVVIDERGYVFNYQEYIGNIDVRSMLTSETPEIYIRNNALKTDVCFIREEQEYYG